MQGQFEKASLEVQFNDGSDKLLKQSFANLKADVTEATLGTIHEANSSISAYPTGDIVVVERTRYAKVGG